MGNIRFRRRTLIQAGGTLAAYQAWRAQFGQLFLQVVGIALGVLVGELEEADLVFAEAQKRQLQAGGG